MVSSVYKHFFNEISEQKTNKSKPVNENTSTENFSPRFISQHLFC